jgi:hypothetical protein
MPLGDKISEKSEFIFQLIMNMKSDISEQGLKYIIYEIVYGLMISALFNTSIIIYKKHKYKQKRERN